MGKLSDRPVAELLRCARREDRNAAGFLKHLPIPPRHHPHMLHPKRPGLSIDARLLAHPPSNALRPKIDRARICIHRPPRIHHGSTHHGRVTSRQGNLYLRRHPSRSVRTLLRSSSSTPISQPQRAEQHRHYMQISSHHLSRFNSSHSISFSV